MNTTTQDARTQAFSINENDINGEFIRLSADLAYWNAQVAELTRVFNIEKLNTKTVWATLLIAQRAMLEMNKGKTTVGEVEAAVQIDSRYIAAVNAEIEAEFQRQDAMGVVEAIRAKRDMLMQYGANRRAELTAEPYLRQG